MREIYSDARQHLYRSQWWTRLAAFTESPVERSPEKVDRKQGATSVTKALAFLFRGFTPTRRENFINSSR
jgi:hypothetical protein